jgi:predicted small secreted protein
MAWIMSRRNRKDDRMRLTRWLKVILAFGAPASMLGCNTMEAVGEDIEAAGEGIEDAAE